MDQNSAPVYSYLLFHDDLYCYVEYVNVEYQLERSSQVIIKHHSQKQMVDFGFGNRFHDLKYFEVGSSFHIS